MHGASHACTAGLQGRGKRLSSAYAWRQSRSRLAMCADSDVTSPGQSRSRSDSAFRHVPRRVGPRLPERTTPSRRGGATSLVQHVLRGALVQLSRRLPVCACASREREGVKERASEREGGGEGLEYGVFERDTGERGGVRRAMRRADSSARRHLLARSHGGGERVDAGLRHARCDTISAAALRVAVCHRPLTRLGALASWTHSCRRNS